MLISSENLRKFSEEHGNLWEFPKTLETLQTRFWELKRFELFEQNVFIRKNLNVAIFGNLQKFLEKFGDGLKWF